MTIPHPRRSRPVVPRTELPRPLHLADAAAYLRLSLSGVMAHWRRGHLRAVQTLTQGHVYFGEDVIALAKARLRRWQGWRVPRPCFGAGPKTTSEVPVEQLETLLELLLGEEHAAAERAALAERALQRQAREAQAREARETQEQEAQALREEEARLPKLGTVELYGTAGKLKRRWRLLTRAQAERISLRFTTALAWIPQTHHPQKLTRWYLRGEAAKPFAISRSRKTPEPEAKTRTKRRPQPEQDPIELDGLGPLSPEEAQEFHAAAVSPWHERRAKAKADRLQAERLDLEQRLGAAFWLNESNQPASKRSALREKACRALAGQVPFEEIDVPLARQMEREKWRALKQAKRASTSADSRPAETQARPPRA